MSYPFKEIIIIYNPNSTGPSKKNALDLQKELKSRLPDGVNVATKGTKDVGHAEEIGASYAKKDTRTLLISSSGDGGYNELVNGVLQHKTKHLTVAVMPSGNANDHHHATANQGFVERIAQGKTHKIDVIEVSATKYSKPWKRYAHSYVGLGMTAYIGEKLTKADLNPLNEKWMVVKYMLKFSHVTLKMGRATRWTKYSNVIFANIDRISKVIKLSDGTKLNDGKFEVYQSLPSQSLNYLLKGVFLGLEPSHQVSSYHLVTKHAYQIQLDGEVFELDSGKIAVTSRKTILSTLL